MGLHQSEHFPELIHGAEAPGKNDERFRDLREPEFTHEEVFEIEAQLGADVRICKLFVRKLDRKTDGLATGFVSAAIRRFHDARPAAGTNNEAARPGAQRERPRSQLVRKLASFFIVPGHFEQALRAPQGRAVFGPVHQGHLRNLFFFQTHVTRVRGVVRLNARGAEHHNGVADALPL